LCDSKTRKGLVHLSQKGLVRLTQKGLVTDVLDSSLDLSSYALFCSKGHVMLVVIRELLALSFVSVLAVDPFDILKLWLFSVDFHFSYFFCNLVSLGCACD